MTGKILHTVGIFIDLLGPNQTQSLQVVLCLAHPTSIATGLKGKTSISGDEETQEGTILAEILGRFELNLAYCWDHYLACWDKTRPNHCQ